MNEHEATHIEASAELQAGKKYRIEVLYKNFAGDAAIELLWAPPRPTLIEQAVVAAKVADVVVLVLGLSQRLEGEEMPIKIEDSVVATVPALIFLLPRKNSWMLLRQPENL